MMIVPKIPSPAKKTMRKSSDIPASIVKSEEKKTEKPPFRLAVDDTKPVLQDPVKKRILTFSLFWNSNLKLN